MGSGASKNGTSMAIAPTTNAAVEEKEPQKVDSRLPFSDFRELFTLKNYWKTVRRNDTQCAKTMAYKCGMGKGGKATVFVLYWLGNATHQWDSHSLLHSVCFPIDRYLKTCPEAKARYPKLSALDVDSPECSEPAFEGMASNYLKVSGALQPIHTPNPIHPIQRIAFISKVFDDVISAVEQTPADATAACQRLSAIGKLHRAKVGKRLNGIGLNLFF